MSHADREWLIEWSRLVLELEGHIAERNQPKALAAAKALKAYHESCPPAVREHWARQKRSKAN